MKEFIGHNVIENVLLSKYTTLKIGGYAKYFADVSNEKSLLRLIINANNNNIPWYVIAGGSNLLISDSGVNGLVIHICFCGIKKNRNNIIVKAGTMLQDFIDYVIDKGFKGIEKMSGIPGTIGGAIYGNAGAYGQTISDRLKKVRVFDGKKIRWLGKAKCGFKYRESIFKRNRYIILEAEFKFCKAEREEARKEAAKIIKIRKEKFPRDLKCPGSFFKNVSIKDLTKETILKIPSEKIYFGKVAAGYLLESVGAKGKQEGKAKIAENHGNLIINTGGAKAIDLSRLALKYSKKVKERYGIDLEPEVQFIGYNYFTKP